MVLNNVDLKNIVNEYNNNGTVHVNNVDEFKYNILIDLNDKRIGNRTILTNLIDPIKTTTIIIKDDETTIKNKIGTILKDCKSYLQDDITKYSYVTKEMSSLFRNSMFLYNIMLYLKNEDNDICRILHDVIDQFMVFHFNNIVLVSGLKFRITSYTEDILNYINMEFKDHSVPQGSMEYISKELETIANGVLKALYKDDIVLNIINNKNTNSNRINIVINTQLPLVIGTLFNIPGCLGGDFLPYSTGKQVIKSNYKEFDDLSSIVSRYNIGYFLLYCNNLYRHNKCVYVAFNKLTNQFTLLV